MSNLVNGNNRRCLPDGRKGIKSPEKIKNMKKKVHNRVRKMLYHGIGNFI